MPYDTYEFSYEKEENHQRETGIQKSIAHKIQQFRKDSKIQ